MLSKLATQAVRTIPGALNRRSVLFLLGLFLFSVGPAPAQEWVRFRGPNGTGISDAATVPTAFTEHDFNWKTKLPGVGHSSPVIWEDRVFVTSGNNDDATRVALCLSTDDGHVIWSRQYASTVHTKHQLNSFATPTPTVDADHVYVVWSSPEEYSVRALSHAGQEVWHRSLGTFASQHSCGTSPILYEDLLILGNDQDGPSFLIALDRKSGEIKWQTPRNSREVSYVTPCVFQPVGGQPQLIFNSGAQGVTAIDPRSGSPIWELTDVFDKRTCSSPVIAGNLLIGTCGSGGGGNYVAAVDPGSADAKARPRIAYKITKSAPYVPTPIYHDGLLYLWSDQGVVSCVQAEGGEILWQNRVGGRYFGSPICIASRLYALSDAGEIVVIAAAPRFELLAKNSVGEGGHSTLAVDRGTLYVRTFSNLISVGGK